MVNKATRLASSNNYYGYDLLVERHQSQLYKLCFKLSRSKEDADDLFQDTWIKAIQSIKQYDLDSNFENYLYTICINIYRDRYNKEKRWLKIIKHKFSKEEKESILETTPASQQVEDIVLVNEQRNLIERCLAKLNDKYRIPLILFYLKDQKISEIAVILDLPVGTIKSRLYTGKSKLKKLMEVNQ